MSIRVQAMTPADIPGAISAIQAAFADDPYNRWVYPDRANFNPERNCASLTLRCHWGIRNGRFLVAKNDGDPAGAVLGVAMWLLPRPVAAPPTWREWLEGWRLWFGQVGMNLWWGRGGLNVKRYYIWKASQAAAQSELWTDPRGYYFLNIMVVAPEAQGRGIGKALARQITDEADARGMPCYLESSRYVPNVQIYEKMGFRLVRDMKCDDDGAICTLYCMVRDPVESVVEPAGGLVV